MNAWNALYAALVLAAAFMTLQGAETLPVKPQRYFNDYTGVVQTSMANSLNERLAGYERASSNQLLVAIYSRMLTDSSLDDYCARAFEKWGVGLKDKDNGAVLFVFTEDRKMRIQTGYGLEASLTDAECFHIIEGMKPYFRNGDYSGGAKHAVDAMIAATQGEYMGTGKTLAEKKPNYFGLYVLLGVLAFIIFKVWLNVRRNRERGYLYGPGGRRIYDPTWLDTVAWGTDGKGWSSSSSSSSGSGWSSGGGSSWSGGGGSTGGGGASGSW